MTESQLIRESSGNKERLERYNKVRASVHAAIQADVAERVRIDPHPTAEEYTMGAFVEELEPQVRDAVLAFNRKGYSTVASGFWGHAGDIQAIDGAFTLDMATQAAIRRLGVTINESMAWGRSYTVLTFRPDRPDLVEMKTMWDHIAAALPDLGHPATPALNTRSELFRRTYSTQTQ